MAKIPDLYQPLVERYADVFKAPNSVVERAVQHKIDLINPDLPPSKHRLYRMSPAEMDACRTEVERLLSNGWIQPSSSPYGAPLLLIRKKTGELRIVIDYRLLNKNTRLDKFPLPRIDDLLDRLSGATVFSKVDLTNAYHQVPLHPADRHKTAFITPKGLYEWVVLPLGLCNAPATF